MDNITIDTDGIIFDVDGTIWDTTHVVKEAWNEAMDEMNLSYAHVTADVLKMNFGLPMIDIIKNILPNEPDSIRQQFMPLCYEKEDEFLKRTPGDLYPNMIESIKSLASKKPLFIVSNCQGGYIELLLEKTGLNDYFKDFTCPAYTDKLKAENIKIICERNNIKKPIYVGDTNMDHEACKKAQVPFVFCSYGFGQTENPNYTIDDISELVKMVI